VLFDPTRYCHDVMCWHNGKVSGHTTKRSSFPVRASQRNNSLQVFHNHMPLLASDIKLLLTKGECWNVNRHVAQHVTH